MKLLTQLETDQPGFASPHRYLGAIWLAEGVDVAYLREMRLMAQARHDVEAASLVDVGIKGLERGGHAGMLRAMLSAQATFYRAGRVSAYAVAATCAKLADWECAMKYLKISIARREAENISLKTDPRFVVMRTDGRFGQLVAETGL